MRERRAGVLWLLKAAAAAVVFVALAAPAQAANAPGAPGARPTWAPADKDGFGTSATTASHVWYTLRGGYLSEVYYPDLGTPSVRDLEFIVTDGRTFTDRERGSAMRHRIQLADTRSLTYEQISTDRGGRYQLTKTYVTDPQRDVVLVEVDFRALRGGPYRLYLRYDPSLANDGADDSASTGEALLSSDRSAGSALLASPALRDGTSGFAGTPSDGWRDLARDHSLDRHYAAARRGSVVQVARTALTGAAGHRQMTLALGLGRTTGAARAAAAASLRAGFESVSTAYAAGWDEYLSGLDDAPTSVADLQTEYDVSLMVLAASEDKQHRGASIASPTMPWTWGDGTVEKPSGVYHAVWSRDLYQVATAQLAAGDKEAANRALDFLLQRQMKRDGSFPQNSFVDGEQHWSETQLDQSALPVILAWQLDRADAATWQRLRLAADYVAGKGPKTPQERWENQRGYSPATIAAEIAALVCGADLARRNGDTDRAARYEAKADEWQRAVEGWTATRNGPLSDKPYYLRLTRNRDPNSRLAYAMGDGGPSEIDQRAVVDPSFLDLVRLGVKRADDPVIVSTLDVVDARLKVQTPNGPFWHRFNFDGYGETRDGAPWTISDRNDLYRTFGRAWPLLTGERGEYELAAGREAGAYLRAMAASANDGYMIPEQVWDERAPSGRRGFPRGEGTFSATPLAWAHAQFVRLAWSIDVGSPVERPQVVACRYAQVCDEEPGSGDDEPD